MSVQKTILPNGLTVISETYPRLETVSLGVWTDAGARDEHETENGLAHLLEHMAFKGTPTRTAHDIASTIENAGGDINAATSMEVTSYTARVLKDDWRMALDVLADIIANPVFDETELAREKTVIHQEIAAANDTPADLVYDLGHECAYANQAIGRPILGPPEAVSRFTAKDLDSFRTRQYVGPAMVVCAVGNIAHDDIVTAVTNGPLADFAKAAPPTRTIANFTGGEQTRQKPLDQTHILISLPTEGYLHKDIYAAQMLAIIAGGGMSSRLFQEVREKRGLCYAVYSHLSAFKDAGLFSIYAATAPDLAQDLTKVTIDTLSDLKSAIKAEEVTRARNQIKAALVMSLESPAARADQLARQQLAYGAPRDMASLLAKIEAVDAAALKSLAETLLTPNELSLAAVGTVDKLPTGDELIKRFRS